jgi:hypothetical protein
MRSSEIPASTRPAESFIAPLNPAIAKQQTHSPANHQAISVEGQLESEAAKRARRV